jgi:hypothetical protein
MVGFGYPVHTIHLWIWLTKRCILRRKIYDCGAPGRVMTNDLLIPAQLEGVVVFLSVRPIQAECIFIYIKHRTYGQ